MVVVGITFVIVAYLVGGAYLFKELETDYAEEYFSNVRAIDDAFSAHRQLLIADFIDITAMCRNTGCADNNSRGFSLLLDLYQETFAYAVQNSGYEGYAPPEKYTKWSTPSAILFTLSILTTIGKYNINFTRSSTHSNDVSILIGA